MGPFYFLLKIPSAISLCSNLPKTNPLCFCLKMSLPCPRPWRVFFTQCRILHWIWIFFQHFENFCLLPSGFYFILLHYFNFLFILKLLLFYFTLFIFEVTTVCLMSLLRNSCVLLSLVTSHIFPLSLIFSPFLWWGFSRDFSCLNLCQFGKL